MGTLIEGFISNFGTTSPQSNIFLTPAVDKLCKGFFSFQLFFENIQWAGILKSFKAAVNHNYFAGTQNLWRLSNRQSLFFSLDILTKLAQNYTEWIAAPSLLRSRVDILHCDPCDWSLTCNVRSLDTWYCPSRETRNWKNKQMVQSFASLCFEWIKGIPL